MEQSGGNTTKGPYVRTSKSPSRPTVERLGSTGRGGLFPPLPLLYRAEGGPAATKELDRAGAKLPEERLRRGVAGPPKASRLVQEALSNGLLPLRFRHLGEELEKLEDKWTELLKCAKIPLNALETQSEQLRLVRSQEVDNAELCQVGNLRDRLVYQIRMGIENEIVLLQEIVTRMNTANQELGNKLTQLENARTKIPLSTPEIMYLVRGSPYLPRLDLLMEWALDGYLYYQDLYRGICMALKSIDSSDKRTVDTLSERFMEDKFRRARQDRLRFIGFQGF
ncbi:uncharacterized protein LOC105697430 isoform X2 [Orussus abietinus]|uniref:uncharacterized protein LOC105697430 isoform X2 n=1 Tax=Orussus abietinus TaxID=222816 RepID=UPI000C71615E|nr:uncharacterized protein LOC105697430 isoform X2 [Orussus abietinus]